MGDMDQASYVGPRNIRRHRKKFRSHGILAPRVCSPLG